MRLPIIPLLATAALALAACEPASPLVDRSGIREVAANDARGCTPISVITTTTGVTGSIGREKALELARNETKEKAREAGADTVVYENGWPGSDDLFVRAAAYRCL